MHTQKGRHRSDGLLLNLVQLRSSEMLTQEPFGDLS